MKDFKTVWKSLAKNKEATNAETFQYCLLRAMAAKHEDKAMIALYFIERAYTPITNQNKLANGMRKYSALADASWRSTKKSESPLIGCLETEEEINLFFELRDRIVRDINEVSEKYYSFFFVRQDMPKEYQLVQTAHVSLALGYLMARQDVSPLQDDMVQNLHFVVCPAKDEEELKLIALDIRNHGYQVTMFNESDLDNTVTAIASFPIVGNKKYFLHEHKILEWSNYRVLSAYSNVVIGEDRTVNYEFGYHFPYPATEVPYSETGK